MTRKIAIESENLKKTFYVGLGIRKKRLEALKGVSFRVYKGEIFSLLGPNGAGKTTTVRIISTLLDPDEGWARVGGFDVVKERWEVRKIIGVMLSVERGFFWKLSARENLYYFGRLYGIPRRELDTRIDEVLEAVGLKALGADNKTFEEMSLGMKARLGLARVLLKDPEVMILDEPTLGLDPASARTIRDMLKKMARAGKTILVTTHNMLEAEIISYKVAIIVSGRIVAQGSPEELKTKFYNTVPIVFRIRATPASSISKLKTVLSASLKTPFRLSFEGDEGFIRIVIPSMEREEHYIELVTRAIYDSGFKLAEARIEEPTLEDVYLKVSSGGVIPRRR